MASQIDHAVVGVIVMRDDTFLVVKETKDGRQGLYNVPGGHVEPHETLFEAAVREVKEESGYDVELTGLLGVYQTILPHINVSGPVFSAKVLGGDAVVSKAHPEVRWVTIEELRNLSKKGQFFTSYPPHAAEMMIQGRLLPLEAVICKRID